jgi:uncharacterized membrane protein
MPKELSQSLRVLSFRQMTEQPTETFYYSRSDSRPMCSSSIAESLAIKVRSIFPTKCALMSHSTLFLAQLLFTIIFLLWEVLLNTPFLSILYQHFLRLSLPKSYGPDTEVHLRPYVASGLLFVSVTTLLFFIATGLFSENIGYAKRCGHDDFLRNLPHLLLCSYVLHANPAL